MKWGTTPRLWQEWACISLSTEWCWHRKDLLGSIGLDEEGVLGLGITLIPASHRTAISGPVAGRATMVITGTLTISPTGRLEIPLVGSSPGQYGSLAVTGSAALDGVLALDFSQGYAPKQGDTFTFLTATGGTSGTFDSVEISGLAPGFEYELTIVDGQVTLEALNDGEPLRVVFLPLVVR